MKHWINKNYKTLIIAAFLIPIITVAIVSISHVTQWYGLSNPITWAVYLSIGIEIAALSALAAISANMGKKVYFPFSIVTIIQFIGNIFFAYSYININSENFKMWVELVSPLLEFMGVESGDYVGHKRFLALFAGGMLPIISLSFLHMLVKFTEEDRLKEVENENGIDIIIDDGGINQEIQNIKSKSNPEDLKNFVDESIRIRLTENDLKKLEEILANPPQPNEELKKAAKTYSEDLKNDIEETKDMVNKPSDEERAKILSEIMQKDEELGLYETPLIEEENKEVFPAMSDEEVREMFMDEWERKFEMVEDESQQSTPPTNASEMMLTTNQEIIEYIQSDDDDDDDDNWGDDEIESVLNTIPTHIPKVEEFSTINVTPVEENEKFSTITVNIENIVENKEEEPKVQPEETIEVSPEEDNVNDDVITKMRDIFFKDNEEEEIEEKKNLLEEPQILTSSLVDSEESADESIYLENGNLETEEEIIDLNNNQSTVISTEEEIVTTPEPIVQEPVDVTRKVFSRNVNNTRRKNFR